MRPHGSGSILMALISISIVLDEGKMVGMGTHQELMQTCPVYQEIARSQLSLEELGA